MRVRTGIGTVIDAAVGPFGDDNTGIVFPAADTLGLVAGGTRGLVYTKATGANALSGIARGAVGSGVGVLDPAAVWEVAQNTTGTVEIAVVNESINGVHAAAMIVGVGGSVGGGSAGLVNTGYIALGGSATITAMEFRNAVTNGYISWVTGGDTEAFEKMRLLTDGGLILGATSAKVGGTGPLVEVNAGGSQPTSTIASWNNAVGNSGVLRFAKSKSSTVGTKASVASGDSLAQVVVNGVDAAGSPAFATAVDFQFECDAAPGAGYVPGRWAVFTTSPAGVRAERWRVSAVGALTSQAATPTNTNIAGMITATGGLAVGADALNNVIDDASNGTGSTALYIGNALILKNNGINFGPAAVTSITVVGGQITAIS